MKIAGINSSQGFVQPHRISKPATLYPANAKQQESGIVNAAAVQNIAFHGLFRSAPDLSEKFKYGLQALDDTSILVVTSNEEYSNMMLERFSDSIDSPVIKKYTLLVEKKDLKDRDALESNFAVFKKNNDFYVLNLHHIFGLNVQNPKDSYDSDKHNIKPGKLKRLAVGEAIKTGELVFSPDKDKLIFNPPYKFMPEPAEKYLAVSSAIAKKEDLSAFNKRTVAAVNASAKKQVSSKKEITFADIGGLDDVIDTLKKFVIRPINYPKVFENIRLNKGILLYGPPRCGKTILAKALAAETGANYKEINANQFKRSEVGASEASVRKAFEKLIADAPSIMFIDEIDAIAKARDGSSNARYDDSLVNQLLGCMSDLEKSNAPSFVVAATNMKELMEPALLASGRFGLQIEVPMPNLEGLKQIYDIHSKKLEFDSDVKIDELAPIMLQHKFNGSDVPEMISDSYFNALERLGMNAKMDAKTFGYDDLKSIRIAKQDLMKAIERIAKQKI